MSTNDWSVNIDNGLLNGAVFIDLKKAFDIIDHGILFLVELKNVLSMVNFQILFQLLVVFHKEAAWDRCCSLSASTTCQIA